MNRAMALASLLLALVCCACRGAAKRSYDGPDPSAMCSAAGSNERDPAKRFGRAIPIDRGGGVYVLTGSPDTTASLAASLGLAQVVIARCDPGDRLVVWVPGLMADADGGDRLGDSFERNGLHVVERYTFHPVARGAR